MFKITALLCVMAVNGQDLCLEGDIPLAQPINSERQCYETIHNITMVTIEEFNRRNIHLGMKCMQLGEQAW